jgi:hypothetical protein
LPIDDPQGFVRRVEQKGHFHAVTSFPTEAPCMGGPRCSIGIRTYFYAISLARNQATDGSPDCACSIGQSAKEKKQRHA